MSDTCANVTRELSAPAILVGATALAAVALSSPIGATGGAVFGCFSYLIGRPVQYICEEVFNTNKATASTLSKVISLTISFLAATAIAVWLTGLVGFSLTLKEAVILSLVAGGVIVGALLIINGIANSRFKQANA